MSCWLILLFACIVCGRFTLASRFAPFELTGNVNRFTDGRPFDGQSELARSVANDPNKYWNELIHTWDEYIQLRSEIIFQQWNQTVLQNNLVNRGVSKECLNVIQYMIKHPIDQEWSAKIIDSMSTFPAGILSSTTTELGDFDQCLSVDGSYEQRHFVGKYCLATLNLPRPSLFEPLTHFNSSTLRPSWIGKYIEHWYHVDNRFPIATGLCFPSICHQNEIKLILQSYYQFLNSFEFNVTYCQSKEDPPEYDPRLKIALTILIIPIALIALAFLFELFFTTDESSPIWQKILQSFSPTTNTRILFHIVENHSSENSKFQFIHGIRALGSIFIMCAHVISLIIFPVLHVNAFARFPNDFQDMARMLLMHVVFNGGLIVHTFFLISGMLFAYNGLSPKLKISFVPYVLIRWLRYTPAVVGMTCLSISLELFGSGPLWHHDHLYINLGGCYDYWWTNILYIQHLIPLDHQCTIHSWYLGAEMQLHIIAFILMLAYTRSSRLTYWTSIMFISLQAFATIYVLLSGWAQPTSFHYFSFMQNPFPQYLYNLRMLYLLTFNQLIPYFVGAIIGQMLLEKKIVRFSKITTRFFWILSFIIIIFMFCHTYPALQVPTEKLQYSLSPSLGTALLIFTLTLAWSLANGWIFYQCATNVSNSVSQFLSAKIFQPFSRISFSLYMVHLMTVWYNVFQTRTTISLAGLNGLWQMVGLTFIQSYALAYFLYLTFEAPGVNLMKIFFLKQADTKVGNKNVDFNANEIFNSLDDDEGILKKAN